jgi:hypothetical protein
MAITRDLRRMMITREAISIRVAVLRTPFLFVALSVSVRCLCSQMMSVG